MKFGKQRHHIISPYMMAGVLVVLLPVFVYMTFDRMERQRAYIRERLLAEGTSLIRTFEAGTRAGMLSMSWGIRRVQSMILETSFQPDISYIMITSKTGQILAHSDESMVGEYFEAMPDTASLDKDVLSFSDRTRDLDEGRVFEVFKRYTPLKSRFMGRPGHRGGKRMHHPPSLAVPDADMDDTGPDPDVFKTPGAPPVFTDSGEYYIFAGFSMDRANLLERQLIKHSVGSGILFFLLCGAGVISLMAYQRYRSARADLTQVQAFSDNVVENMPSGLVAIDTGHTITLVNQAAIRILGNGFSRPFPEMRQMADQMAVSGEAVLKEVTLTRQKGGDLRLDITGSPIRNKDSNVIGFLFLFKDMTQIRSLQKEVETTRRLAAIGKLAGGVAHEIRNPLSSIKGFATYFMKRYENEPADVETARIMVQEVERINLSITQLLEFAKPLAVEKKTVEVMPLITHSLRLADHDFKEKKIHTKVEIDPGLPGFMTDPDRLNQVLLNLYINAVNAMAPEGKLFVRAGVGPDKRHLEIEVGDTGCGMDQETLENIFDPYFTTRQSGTGLGLSIVHRIVENLGGDIRVDSVPGKGTRFILSFPLTAAKEKDLNK